MALYVATGYWVDGYAEGDGAVSVGSALYVATGYWVDGYAEGDGAVSVGSAHGRRYRSPRHYTIGDKHYVVYDDNGLRLLLAELLQKENVPVAKKVKIKAEPVRVYEPDHEPIQAWDVIELPRVNMATADALIAQSVKFGQDEIVSAIEQMIRRRREEEEELLMLATFLH